MRAGVLRSERQSTHFCDVWVPSWLHECDANGATVCETPTEEHLLETTQLTTATHAHHWRINEPNGEFSHAVCKSCGAERAFRNWLAETDYISRSEIGLAA